MLLRGWGDQLGRSDTVRVERGHRWPLFATRSCTYGFVSARIVPPNSRDACDDARATGRRQTAVKEAPHVGSCGSLVVQQNIHAIDLGEQGHLELLQAAVPCTVAPAVGCQTPPTRCVPRNPKQSRGLHAACTPVTRPPPHGCKHSPVEHRVGGPGTNPDALVVVGQGPRHAPLPAARVPAVRPCAANLVPQGRNACSGPAKGAGLLRAEVDRRRRCFVDDHLMQMSLFEGRVGCVGPADGP